MSRLGLIILVLWGYSVGGIERNGFGNKMDYTDPDCIRELESEMGLNASRLVEVIYKDEIAEIALQAGNIAWESIDPTRNHLDLQSVAEDVSSYVIGALRKFELEDKMKFISRIILGKLCKFYNCCYLP